MAGVPMLRMLREVKCELLRLPVRLSNAQIRFIASPAFTRSGEWVRLRYDFMRDHDGRCECCGRRGLDGVQVNVDHILPRRTHPQFALCYANLQVLCGPCNRARAIATSDRGGHRRSRP